MTHSILKLDPIIFPEESPWRREDFLEKQDRFDDYEDKYDNRTLFYQAIAEGEQLRLIAPKLLNFEEVLKKGQFSVNKRPLKIKKIINYRRHSEVLLKLPVPAEELRFEIDGFSKTVRCLQRGSHFIDKNVLITRQKDNLLEWIDVWGRYHVLNQGVTGIIIVDNGSTKYDVQTLSDCLAKIDGLEASVVVDAPFKFGPMAKNRPRNRGLFFQAAMLNLVKHALAYNANAAALCVDIDELIFSPSNETIFDEVARSKFGYTCIKGHWRYAKQASQARILHSDHKYKSSSRDWSREKYCVRLNGRLKALPWDIHNVGRGRLNKIFFSKTKGFYHCEQLSTSWIVDRNKPSVDDLALSNSTQDFLNKNIEPLEQSNPSK